MFLKKLERIELLRNGKLVSVVTRKISDNTIRVDRDGEVTCWRVFETNFSAKAMMLKSRYGGVIDRDRSERVRVAVPDSVVDHGLLFATLPTEQSTGLPFHIDADFYPRLTGSPSSSEMHTIRDLSGTERRYEQPQPQRRLT